jgi:hypothetical protein
VHRRPRSAERARGVAVGDAVVADDDKQEAAAPVPGELDPQQRRSNSLTQHAAPSCWACSASGGPDVVTGGCRRLGHRRCDKPEDRRQRDEQEVQLGGRRQSRWLSVANATEQR